MILVLEIALAIGICLLCRWLWRLSGHSIIGLLLASAVLAAFFMPWLRAADWGQLGRISLVLAVAAVPVLGYAWALARIRAAVRRRDEGR